MTRRRKLLFSLISIFLALGLIEATFRISQPNFDFEKWRASRVKYRIGPPGVFRMIPGTYQPKREQWVINRLGFRGREPKVGKGAVYRIIVLGGSSVFMGDVPWPELLEQRLRQSGHPVEVINASCPGWSTYHTAKLLDAELMAYHPDLVVVYQLWNDMKFFAESDPERMVQTWENKARNSVAFSMLPPNPWLDPISRVLKFTGYIRYRRIRAWQKSDSAIDEGISYATLDHQITDAGVDFYRKNLERIIQTSTAGGARVALVKEARLAAADNTPAERDVISYQYVGFSPAVLLEAYRRGDEGCDRLCGQYPGVICLDATRAVPSDLKYFRDHVHLTGPGREVLAEYLAGELAALIPAGQDRVSKETSLQ